MPDAQDVDSVASDLKKDAVGASPLAIKQLAKVSRIPFGFGSKPTPLGMEFQGADGFQKLLMPPASGWPGTPGDPFQRAIDFAQCPRRDADRMHHRSLAFAVQVVFFAQTFEGLDGWFRTSRLDIGAAFAQELD